MTPIEAYIRQAALQRGINPDIAVAVARSEGGLNDPVRQSDIVKNGVREPSFGPFQLYFGGGLGNAALKQGIDARDPGQWQRGVDFALNHALQNGWGAWYGAAKAGIDDWAGLKGGTVGPISAAMPPPAVPAGASPIGTALAGLGSGLEPDFAEISAPEMVPNGPLAAMDVANQGEMRLNGLKEQLFPARRPMSTALDPMKLLAASRGAPLFANTATVPG